MLQRAVGSPPPTSPGGGEQVCKQISGVLLEHALNAAPVSSPEGPGQSELSVPQGTAPGHQRVLGKSMAYQVPGRAWVGDLVRGHSVQLLCPLPPLWIWGWLPGADHRWVSLPRLLCGSTQGASCSAWLGSQTPEEPRRSHLPPTDPEASAPRLCRQELGPSLLAPKVTQGWSSHGWQVPQPPGQCVLPPPHSFVPANLPGPTGSTAWGWRAPPPAGSISNQHLGWGTGGSGHMSKKNGFDSKGDDPDATAEHLGLRRGRQVPPRLRGGCRLHDSALTPHLLSGKCLITVHSSKSRKRYNKSELQYI